MFPQAVRASGRRVLALAFPQHLWVMFTLAQESPETSKTFPRRNLAILGLRIGEHGSGR